MQKLIAIIVAAIEVIAGYKATIASQQAHIDDLQKQLDDDTANDAELEARAKAAEDRAAKIESDLADANSKADELAAAINADPRVQNVDTDFNVTGEATAAPDANVRTVDPSAPNIPGIDLPANHQTATQQPAQPPAEEPAPEEQPAPSEPASEQVEQPQVPQPSPAENPPAETPPANPV